MSTNHTGQAAAQAFAFSKFDPNLAANFCERSTSEATRRTYSRIIREFFFFAGGTHPTQIMPDDIRLWRDTLQQQRKKPATIALQLSVMRSFFEYLRVNGLLNINPASTKFVATPLVKVEPGGRALSAKEVRYLLAGPNQATADGARDYALLLVLTRLGIRVSEVCSLKTSSIRWDQGSWTLKFKVRGGVERILPLPMEVKRAIEDYLRKDAERRAQLHSNGSEAYLFQPHSNYRTLVFDRALTARWVEKLVVKWSDYAGLGRVSPHDLRRTAITKALGQGLSYKQVQAMSGHRDPKTLMRYDMERENLAMNAVNFLSYDETEPVNSAGRLPK